MIDIANADIRRKLRVAYNSVFRQVFGYKLNEFVTDLQHTLGRPTWEGPMERRKSKNMRFRSVLVGRSGQSENSCSHFKLILFGVCFFFLSNIDIISPNIKSNQTVSGVYCLAG